MDKVIIVAVTGIFFIPLTLVLIKFVDAITTELRQEEDSGDNDNKNGKA